MKYFILSFVLSFAILLAGFFGMERLVRIEQETSERQASETSDFDNTAPDDFAMPTVPVSATASAADTGSEFSALPVEKENKELESLFTAIAGDDGATVAEFIKRRIRLDQETAWRCEVGSDNQFRFYASQPTMLYNPLSLAIVAGASQSLPLLLEAASNSQCLEALNAMTCKERKGFDQLGFDLIGLALQSGDLELLRALLAAGLKPKRQGYLIVAMNASKRADVAELGPEIRLTMMRNKADLFVELINNGQRIDQRLPFPFPVPPVTEMFFAFAGPEITADVISRISDPDNRSGLQKIADKIKRPPPGKKSQTAVVATFPAAVAPLTKIKNYTDALDGLLLALKTAGRKCPRSFMEKGSETIDGRTYFVIQAGENNAYRFETHNWYYIEKHTGMIFTLDVVADRLVETGLRCLHEPADAAGKTAGGTAD